MFYVSTHGAIYTFEVTNEAIRSKACLCTSIFYVQVQSTVVLIQSSENRKQQIV